MNKELEEMIKIYNDLKSNTQIVANIDIDFFFKFAEALLNYIDNSIPKEVIKEKLGELEYKICGNDEYLGNRQCIELELLEKVEKELLEGK